MLPYQGKPYCNIAMEAISSLISYTGPEYDKPKNEPIFDPLAVRFITEIHEIRKTLNIIEPFSLTETSPIHILRLSHKRYKKLEKMNDTRVVKN